MCLFFYVLHVHCTTAVNKKVNIMLPFLQLHVQDGAMKSCETVVVHVYITYQKVIIIFMAGENCT